MATNYSKIVLKCASTSDWARESDPGNGAWKGHVLQKGEPGLEDLGSGSFKVKYGDGTTTWDKLPYFTSGGAAAKSTLTCTINDSSLAADYFVDSTGSKWAVATRVDNDGQTVTAMVVDSDPGVGRKFTLSTTISESNGQSTTINYSDITDRNERVPRVAWSKEDYVVEATTLKKITGEQVTNEEVELIGEILVVTSNNSVVGTMIVKSRDKDKHTVTTTATKYATDYIHPDITIVDGNKW